MFASGGRRLLEDAFLLLREESRRVIIFNKQGDKLGHALAQIQKRRVLHALVDYKNHRYAVAANRLHADKLRDRLLMLVHFRAIHKFSKFKDKKLQAMRTVNQYLHEKRAKRLINVLRKNLDSIKIKEKNLRQAC